MPLGELLKPVSDLVLSLFNEVSDLVLSLFNEVSYKLITAGLYFLVNKHSFSKLCF